MTKKSDDKRIVELMDLESQGELTTELAAEKADLQERRRQAHVDSMFGNGGDGVHRDFPRRKKVKNIG